MDKTFPGRALSGIRGERRKVSAAPKRWWSGRGTALGARLGYPRSRGILPAPKCSDLAASLLLAQLLARLCGSSWGGFQQTLVFLQNNFFALKMFLCAGSALACRPRRFPPLLPSSFCSPSKTEDRTRLQDEPQHFPG